MVKNLKGKYEWCFSRLKCKNIGAILAITSENTKKEEIPYIEAKKQGTKYCLTYLDVSKIEEKYDWCFEGQRTAWKTNVTLLAVINKEIRCACCI